MSNFTNSPLVSYVKLSPNFTDNRDHEIDTITIHCVAGNCSVEALGEIFANPNRQASSNYGIGSDGRIGMYVEEADRSWCTSSKSNDNRAITIEVANITGAPNYNISSEAYSSLINLCVDICKRNNIKQLLWKNDKSLIGQVDKQNMTVHRWFANKACLPINRTELLTKNGWVKLKDIKIGDEIATAHIDNMSIVFSPVLDIVEPYQQDTYTIRDLEATADHRIMYFDNHGKQKIGYFNEIFDKPNCSYLPNAGYYNGPGIDLNDDEIKLLVAVQADGHYMYDDRISENGERIHTDFKEFYGLEFHLKKERKINRILNILNSLGYNPNINKKKDGSISIRIYDKKILNFCFKYLDNKKFKWDLLEMNYTQASHFLEEIKLWDGSLENNSYFSNDIENRDIVIAIAAINGVGALYNNSDSVIDISVSLKPSKRGIGNATKVRKLKQIVSCVTVDSGFILIRQNKRTTIVGNCPGVWLYDNMGIIADTVNKFLEVPLLPTNTDTIKKEDIPVISVPTISNEERLWIFLDKKGLTDIAKAGLMGNLFAESGFNSNNLQNSFEKKLKMNDDQYTSAVDNGSYKNFVKDKAGYGLAQWTYWTRKDALYKFIKSKGKSISDFDLQCEFLFNELSKSYKGVLDKIQSAKTIKSASNIVLTQYERPADQSPTIKTRRYQYALDIYNKYVDSVKNDLPYPVRITATDLKIRKGPGTDTAIVSSKIEPGVYTIIEESSGKGANLWGKLKSGIGWVSLDYCKRI